MGSKAAGLRLRMVASGDADTWKRHIGTGFWDALVVKDVGGDVQVDVYVRGDRGDLGSYKHYLLDRRVLTDGDFPARVCELVQNARGQAVMAVGGVN